MNLCALSIVLELCCESLGSEHTIDFFQRARGRSKSWQKWYTYVAEGK